MRETPEGIGKEGVVVVGTNLEIAGESHRQSPHPDETDVAADTEHFDYTSISSIWNPIASMWP